MINYCAVLRLKLLGSHGSAQKKYRKRGGLEVENLVVPVAQITGYT